MDLRYRLPPTAEWTEAPNVGLDYVMAVLSHEPLYEIERRDTDTWVPVPRQRKPKHITEWLVYDHLKDAGAREVSKLVCDAAHQLNVILPEGPEKTVGLRKLLEAKDCLVRAYYDTD